MPTEINAIIFDCGGVLIHDMRWDLIYEKSKSEYHDKLQESIAEEWVKMKLDINYDEDSFWNMVRDVGNISKDDISKLRLQLSEEIKVFWGSMYIAEQLKKMGFTLCVISNHAKCWFEKFWTRYSMSDVFSKESLVIPSYLVKLDKPNPKVYELMLERLRQVDPKITPEHCVFIDDKPRNLEPAAAIGFKVIHFPASKMDASVLKDELAKFGIKLK